jgi:outer membrane protein, heavy metal efflux system
MRRFEMTLLNRWSATMVTVVALFPWSSARAQQVPSAPSGEPQSDRLSPQFNQLPPPSANYQQQPPPNFQQGAPPRTPQTIPPPPSQGLRPQSSQNLQQQQQVPPASTQLQAPVAMSQGQLVNAWTLPQAELTSLQFNPIVSRAMARITSAAGDAQQASLYPNPRWDTNNPNVFSGHTSSYNAGFMQAVVVKGKKRLDRAAADEVVRQKEHGLVQDRFGLLTAVRQQFYSVLADQRRVMVLGELRDIAASAVRASEGRERATEGTHSEVLLVRTDLYRAEIAVKNAQTILEADRRQLAAIVGRPDLRIDQVVGEFTSGFPDYAPEYLRQFVISQNAQVQIARREINRQLVLLQRARVEPYPNVTVGPAFSNNLATGPGTQQFWFTLQFDIPVWDRNQGNIRSTQGDLADAWASLGALQNDLLSQVEDVLGRYRAARQSEERIRTQILPNATQAQQLVLDGYRKGVLDVSTFLQAQRMLTETSLGYIDALTDVWVTAAQIAGLLQLDRFPLRQISITISSPGSPGH